MRLTNTDNSNLNAKTCLRPAASECMLQTRSTDQEAERYYLFQEIFIGPEDIDIPLKGKHTSRKHAKNTISGSEVALEDLGSITEFIWRLDSCWY